MKKNYIYPSVETAHVAGTTDLLSVSYNVESGDPINYGSGE